MKRQNIILVIVVLVGIVMSAGYSVFSINSDVKKKAASSKQINVIFSEIGKIEKNGIGNSTAFIRNNGKQVIINVNEMKFVGSYAKIPIKIKNIGTLPAKLNSINIYQNSNVPGILVNCEGFDLSNNILNPNEELEIFIKIMWVFEFGKIDAITDFYIDLNYTQNK